MKKISTILSHLSSLPQFKVLKKHACYEKYIQLLTPKFQKAIAFIYIKESTLFITVKHSGFLTEFNYNKNLLISILRDMQKYQEGCEHLYADKVVVFVSKYYDPNALKKASQTTVPYYSELASDKFPILTEDEALKEKFQRIQKVIACKSN